MVFSFFFVALFSRVQKRNDFACLLSETVDGVAVFLERVDNVGGGHGLALLVLGVGNGVTNDSLEEGLEDGTGLRVDFEGDTLDSTTPGETTNGGLGDAKNVIADDVTVPPQVRLSETPGSFAGLATSSLAASRHVECIVFFGKKGF